MMAHKLGTRLAMLPEKYAFSAVMTCIEMKTFRVCKCDRALLSGWARANENFKVKNFFQQVTMKNDWIGFDLCIKKVKATAAGDQKTNVIEACYKKSENLFHI